jgi:hypothetical protein
LSSVEIQHVLQMLADGRKTGCLQVESQKDKTRVFLDNGRVVACSSDDPAKRLGQFLIFRGYLTRSQLETAMAVHEQTGCSLGAVLVEGGWIQVQQLMPELALKAHETVLELFDLQNLAFFFSEGERPTRRDMTLDLDVTDLTIEAANRVEEKREIEVATGGDDAVPECTGLLPSNGFDEESTRNVYAAVDGRRTIQDITLFTHGPTFLVRKTLKKLLDQGLIKVNGGHQAVEREADPHPAPEMDVDRDAIIALVDQQLEEKDAEKALELLSACYREDPTDRRILERLARAEAKLLIQIQRGGFTPDKVPHLTVSRNELEVRAVSPEEQFLASVIDGSWDIQGLIWIAPMRTIDVLQALKGLVKNRAIEMRDRVRVTEAAAT